MFSTVFIAILTKLLQYPRVFIAISPLRIRGVPKRSIFSGFRGSRSCYSRVCIAISLVILQYPRVFIHFLPPFRYPSGAIGDPLGVYIVLLPCVY